MTEVGARAGEAFDENCWARARSRKRRQSIRREGKGRQAKPRCQHTVSRSEGEGERERTGFSDEQNEATEPKNEREALGDERARRG